jgi:surfeit locus 1 family protein
VSSLDLRRIAGRAGECGPPISQFMPLQFKAKLVPTVAAVVGVVVTAFLGNWQLDRAAHKLQLQQRVDLAGVQPPLHLPAAPVHTDEVALYRVEANGEFRPDLTVFLDNKVRDGVIGYEVVTPLRLGDSGPYVLVDRGWVKAPALRSELPAVTTPAGVVRVEGIALPPPRRFFELSEQTVSGRVWQNLPFERYRQTYHVELQPVLLQQHNDLGDGLVRAWSRPDTRVDMHRAYALQWFAMSAVIALIYVLLNVRRKKPTLGAV